MSSQCMKKSRSTIIRQPNSGTVSQMWYFKQWSSIFDGTYGIYSWVDNSIQLTVENVTSPADTERFAIRPSDGSRFIFVSSPWSNLLLLSANISGQNTVRIMNFSFDNANTGCGDQLWRFARLRKNVL